MIGEWGRGTQNDLRDSHKCITAAEHNAGLTTALAAFWYERGRLEAGARIRTARRMCRGIVVHAHLHRKEGDQGNAAYWYNRAGKPVCREPLDAEWLNILKASLG